MMDNVFMKKLLRPTADTLGISINSEKVKEILEEQYNNLKSYITMKMQKKPIHISMDAAKRLHKNVIGINAHFLDGSKIMLAHLGAVSTNSSHTAEFVANTLKDLLLDYDVTIDQVFSVTMDNGANFLAAARRVMEASNESLSFQEMQEIIDNILIESNNENNEENDDEEDEEDVDGLHKKIKIGLNENELNTFSLEIMFINTKSMFEKLRLKHS